ncbi:hypothetical protein PUNSTDRAFT_50034 [Punctularia strigosozonata HHB-11173 SS5]|uniref:uncharacterized protein n=1 Tax=Punctularia strigosozonata (strain HHB-11173) TaxID=741275 RepID=UPI0004417FC6|nr:uncharacterized protein PUNSTDRAFT_50034 [Punctularia strigosozonata HHB-11173 SS5]EIN12806.1 hypothetical protein PUNSTDRAFT_50034 [Punctularia strigosozonata HHB-11173 SS5]
MSDSDDTVMPPPRTSSAVPQDASLPAHVAPQQARRDPNNDSMPSLHTISDSTDGEDSDQSDVDMEDMLQPRLGDDGSDLVGEDNDDMPPLEPITRRAGERRPRSEEDDEASPQRPSRRPRVEVEEEQTESAAPSHTSQHVPPRTHFHPLPPPAAGDRPTGPPANGVAITIDPVTGVWVVPLGGPPNARQPFRPPPGFFQGQGQNTPGTNSEGPAPPEGGAPPFPNFADLFSGLDFDPATLISMFEDYNKEDPERAKRLVDGLEVVPVGLVKRMEHLSVEHSHENSQDEAPGCAICWDSLLEPEGGGFDAQAQDQPADAAGPSPSSSSKAEKANEKEYPKIVSLPCAHVFHASCLIPWFSRPRQTTCPTCRFNIDPENLTYRPPQPRSRPFRTGPTPTGTTSQRQVLVREPTPLPDFSTATQVPLPPSPQPQPTDIPLPSSRPSSPQAVPQGQTPRAAEAQRGPHTQPQQQPGIHEPLLPPRPAPFRHFHHAHANVPPDGAGPGGPPTINIDLIFELPVPGQEGAPGGPPPELMGGVAAQATIRLIQEFFERIGAPNLHAPRQGDGPANAGAGEGRAPGPLPRMPFTFGTGPFSRHHAQGPRREPKEWTLPPAPGLTVRQRVEKRERELGLRCSDPTCGVGPSDEDPYPVQTGPILKEIVVRSADGGTTGGCGHKFHPACLVTAERVAGWDGERKDDAQGADGDVDVCCPACRAIGVVSRAEWDEGVKALA